MPQTYSGRGLIVRVAVDGLYNIGTSHEYFVSVLVLLVCIVPRTDARTVPDIYLERLEKL